MGRNWGGGRVQFPERCWGRGNKKDKLIKFVGLGVLANDLQGAFDG